MFQDTIALKNNPFSPNLSSSPKNRTRLRYLTNLDRMPLRLDQCADVLQPLLCTEILDFQTYVMKFREIMSALGYGFDGEGKRAADSVLIVIRGAKGAGKTTLGAWIVSELARLPGESVTCLHVPDPAPAIDADEARIAALRDPRDSIHKVPHGNHVAGLVENVTSVTEPPRVSHRLQLPNRMEPL
jgi:hypothetical protein